MAPSPVEQAPTSWSPTEGMVGKGQAVPALRESEEEQVWIILGERKEVEKQRGKDLKRKPPSHKRSTVKEYKGQRRRRKG